MRGCLVSTKKKLTYYLCFFFFAERGGGGAKGLSGLSSKKRTFAASFNPLPISIATVSEPDLHYLKVLIECIVISSILC